MESKKEMNIEAIKLMNVIDLFLLSFKSIEARKIIQSVNWEPKKAGIFVRYVDGFFEVVVLSKTPTMKSKLVFTCQPMEHRSMKKEPKMELDVDGQKIKIRIFKKEDNETVVYINKKYQPIFCSFLIQYICDLFNEVVFGAVISKLNKDLRIKRIAHLLVGSGKDVKAHDLDSFLRRNSSERALVVVGKVLGDVPLDSPLYSVDCLFLTHGKRMNHVDLLNFRGEHAFFSEKNLASSDITLFLDRWVFGNVWNLESLIVFSKKTIEVDLEKLVQRYGATKWIPSQRARHYPYSRRMRSLLYERNYTSIFDCADGIDVQRKSDGLIATLKFSNNHFFFFVWHDRFPPIETQLPAKKADNEEVKRYFQI